MVQTIDGQNLKVDFSGNRVYTRCWFDAEATYVWCGAADRTVPPDNRRMLAQSLGEHGVPCVFREYPGIDHGVGLGTGSACEGWFREAVDFWLSQI